jgi:hypothetical protein
VNYTTGYDQWLRAKGVSLQELGLSEVALGRADALHATELLRGGSVPILGGDVYFMRGESVELAFANWHTDRQPGESWADYVNRSCRHSAKYIEDFPHRPDVTPLFVLVAWQDRVCRSSDPDS